MQRKRNSITRIKHIVAVIVALLFSASLHASSTQNMSDIRDMHENILEILAVSPAKQIPTPQAKKITTANEPKPQNTPRSTKPVIHDFSHKTVWGTFTVKVIEYPYKDYFKVTFESKHPVQGIEIMDSTNKNTIYKKNVRDIKRFSEQINFAFKPKYLLIIKANINDEIQPNIIPLYKKAKVRFK